MKLVMLLVGVLFSANAFGLGAFEAFDFNSGFHPVGATLGNVCYTQGALKVIDTGSTCVEYGQEVVEDTKYDIHPRYIKTCEAWKKNGPKTVAMKRNACLKWEVNRKKLLEKIGNKDQCRDCYKCVKTGLVDLPRTQRLDVYAVSIGDNLTSGQNMGSAMYTIPNCEATDELPDTDLPDTNK